MELKLLLVESSLNNSINTHFPWGNSEEGNFITRILDGHFFQNWLRKFKAMESTGQAKILSQAVLLSESGKSSRFLSGGEVPIPHYHPESGTQTIKWKPYGIQLNFETRADRTQTIHIKVQAEISEVNHSHSGQAAPSLKNESCSLFSDHEKWTNLIFVQSPSQTRGEKLICTFNDFPHAFESGRFFH